jgi:hypothetical protein
MGQHSFGIQWRLPATVTLLHHDIDAARALSRPSNRQQLRHLGEAIERGPTIAQPIASTAIAICGPASYHRRSASCARIKQLFTCRSQWRTHLFRLA